MRLPQPLVVLPPREPLVVILVAERDLRHLRGRRTVQSARRVWRDVFPPVKRSLVAVCLHPSWTSRIEGLETSSSVSSSRRLIGTELTTPLLVGSTFLSELLAAGPSGPLRRGTANNSSLRLRDSSTIAGKRVIQVTSNAERHVKLSSERDRAYRLLITLGHVSENCHLRLKAS